MDRTTAFTRTRPPTHRRIARQQSGLIPAQHVARVRIVRPRRGTQRCQRSRARLASIHSTRIRFSFALLCFTHSLTHLLACGGENPRRRLSLKKKDQARLELRRGGTFLLPRKHPERILCTSAPSSVFTLAAILPRTQARTRGCLLYHCLLPALALCTQ